MRNWMIAPRTAPKLTIVASLPETSAEREPRDVPAAADRRQHRVDDVRR